MKELAILLTNDAGTASPGLHAAALGVPAIAVSLETDPQENFFHSTDIDFSVAAYFTRLCAGLMIGAGPIPDVDVLKVEVPADASRDTPWTVTRVSRQCYYEAAPQQLLKNNEGLFLPYRIAFDGETLETDGDILALRVHRFQPARYTMFMAASQI
jgi:broad specificity polyphosphatase/5'/3'-nucleotidase SurE